MSVGQAIRDRRKEQGLKASDLGLPYTDSMIRKIESGERRLAKDVAPQLAQSLDHPALYFALAREYSGGFGPAWLDGENVDLHRSSVREKCIEELEEALVWLDKSASNRPPEAETTSQRKGRREHLLQVMDAAQACYVYVGVQCEAYGFSLLDISKEHYNKLRSLRYVRG
ncbi:helix-turn-helix domain-containing protein [Alicyclobacillus sp. SO9]|uniref:helix-turn-helix domain-containing protein n=1 Tax=Alicyclobacillus sp. SO9 TaxID=2665646 RepID=UPI0018E8596E|nr:helix-turn-helix transcriptional regulator [Alicyclobacillus sp. SO9]QQE80887.1 helix-turn-helix transcriptional regulator [Alicyclobacillus sp. SO9]